MRVLVFGNPLAKEDSAAVKIAEKLSAEMPQIEFARFDTSEDLEREGDELVIMDAVVGLEKPRMIELSELELSARPLSLHGFDLAWNLLLLRKLGKIKRARIIGVPAGKSARGSLPEVRRLLLSQAISELDRKIGEEEAYLVHRAVEAEMEEIRAGRAKTFTLEEVKKRAGLR